MDAQWQTDHQTLQPRLRRQLYDHDYHDNNHHYDHDNNDHDNYDCTPATTTTTTEVSSTSSTTIAVEPVTLTFEAQGGSGEPDAHTGTQDPLFRYLSSHQLVMATYLQVGIRKQMEAARSINLEILPAPRLWIKCDLCAMGCCQCWGRGDGNFSASVTSRNRRSSRGLLELVAGSLSGQRCWSRSGRSCNRSTPEVN